MKYSGKYSGEIVLLALLLVVFYHPDNFLTSMLRVNKSIVMFGIVGIILLLGSYKQYNMGFIVAIIAVVMMSNTQEGASVMSDVGIKSANEKTIEEIPSAEEEEKYAKEQAELEKSGPGDYIPPSSSQKKQEGFSNVPLTPSIIANINVVDNDRNLKLNALKNSEIARGNPGETPRGVVNDVKDVLERVKRLELLQEEAEDRDFNDDGGGGGDIDGGNDSQFL